VEIPDVSYTRRGDVAAAYQVFGAGPVDLLFLPFQFNLWWLWRYPQFPPFMDRLAKTCRIVLVNTRGAGLADRPRGVTIEGRMEDALAVLDAREIERCTVLGIAENSATAALLAASYPERVERLILYSPVARGVRTDDYPWAMTREEWLEQLPIERSRWGDRQFMEELFRHMNPQWADDREAIETFVSGQRMTTSPSGWVEFRRMQMDIDITDVLPVIRVPTLVLTKKDDRDEARYVTDHIPAAHFVELPGQGLAIHEGDGVAVVEAIESFLGGGAAVEVPETVLATILFTDLVGSTERAAELGDRAWRDLLARHHTAVRSELARYRGEERDTAGDGFFATFDGPARAIHCARAVIDRVGELGLVVRAGVHTGECEVHEDKVAGIAVAIGARVASTAGAGNIFVSSTVKDLVAGSGIEFAERGVHQLKGVPGEWRLYSVVDA
jgi:class 3 adenylate cyclase/pimeloyl-ACP methyl ester carboxylesterase